jgi:hypothetical protein
MVALGDKTTGPRNQNAPKGLLQKVTRKTAMDFTATEKVKATSPWGVRRITETETEARKNCLQSRSHLSFTFNFQKLKVKEGLDQLLEENSCPLAISVSPLFSRRSVSRLVLKIGRTPCASRFCGFTNDSAPPDSNPAAHWFSPILDLVGGVLEEHTPRPCRTSFLHSAGQRHRHNIISRTDSFGSFGGRDERVPDL